MFRLIVIHFENTQNFDAVLCGLKSKATTNGSSMLEKLLLWANSNSGRFTWHTIN